MNWPMCSALIDDENVSPSRITVSTSAQVVTRYDGRSKTPIEEPSTRATGHRPRRSCQIGYGWPVKKSTSYVIGSFDCVVIGPPGWLAAQRLPPR